MKGSAAVFLLLLFAACGTKPDAPPREPTAAPGAVQVPRAGEGALLYYVPVYSHIYHRDTASASLLAVTLSIRNTDPHHGLTLRRVDYYDTRGRPLRAYLRAPRPMAPLETAEFVVPRNDETGGSGANFLVELAADSAVTEPLVEAVMVGVTGNVGVSFISPARLLRRP